MLFNEDSRGLAPALQSVYLSKRTRVLDICRVCGLPSVGIKHVPTEIEGLTRGGWKRATYRRYDYACTRSVTYLKL